jgi:hypothetical protein
MTSLSYRRARIGHCLKERLTPRGTALAGVDYLIAGIRASFAMLTFALVKPLLAVVGRNAQAVAVRTTNHRSR